MEKIKKICLWILTAFFGLTAIAFFTSFSSLSSVITAAVVAPIPKWQEIMGKYLKKPIQIIAVVLLFVLVIATAPSEETPSSPDVSVEETEKDPGIVFDDVAEDADQPESDEIVHEHSFAEATCISPQKCTECGETLGEAKGHEWMAATCTAAKSCSVCGVTEGDVTEHSWSPATCSAPKTCTVCGTTTGSSAGHKYSGGKWSVCGKALETSSNSLGSNSTSGGNSSGSAATGDPDGDDSDGIMVYRTPSGKRYHLDPECGGKNSYSVSLQKAKNSGLTPCKKCAQ
ncbi:MAG: hypothetical protein IJ043_03895 [Clostridia bacterium]|nr:hypothetical protein [Clostridia bacterium]